MLMSGGSVIARQNMAIYCLLIQEASVVCSMNFVLKGRKFELSLYSG